MKPTLAANLAAAFVVLLAGAGCYCNPPEPMGFVYSCSGTLQCPDMQQCGVCSGGMVPMGSRVCGPPLTSGICDGWMPIGAAEGSLTAFAFDVDGDGLDDLVADVAPDALDDPALHLPPAPPDLVLTGEAARALAPNAAVLHVWLAAYATF